LILEPAVESHTTGGGDLAGEAPVLVWRFDVPVRAVATAVLGGGVGERWWITNATVGFHYDETDPAAHARRIAAGCGLGEAAGVGLLTAVDVRTFTAATDGGAEVVVTTGLGALTWAAAADGQFEEWAPGTVNVVAWVPAPLADAALVNLVATITEAKVQALAEAGVAATGTPSDAVVVCCPSGHPPADEEHRYGGPRSTWGARIARAAHAAITEGVVRDRARPR
jgi:adenosylcobinamide hydrolase